MGKYTVFAVVFMLVCSVAWGCEYCIENPGEKEIQTNGMGANNGTEQLSKDHLVLVRRINAVDKKVKHTKDTLDKIYSMICDLETKFMGNDRMEQITNPDHIPEVVRQKVDISGLSPSPKKQSCSHSSVENIRPKYRCLECGEWVK